MNVGRLIVVGYLVWAGTAYAESRVLTDEQLDLVTAGATEVFGQSPGTAIVGTDGRLTLERINAVAIQGQAQQGAQALNLVNTQQAQTANAINLWVSGRLDGPSLGESSAAGMTVQQFNEIRQDRPSSARFGTSASLDEAILFGPIVTEIETTSRISQGIAGIDGRINLFGDRTTTSTTDDDTDSKKETFSVQVQAGTGIALAGTGDFEVDAGSFSIDWRNDATTTTTEQVKIFGITVKNEKTTLTVTERLQATIGLGSLQGSVKDGFLCVVAAGNCVGGGDTQTSTTKLRREIMPTSLSNAEAQYIVMSGGDLQIGVVDAVSLSGGAQQGVAAVNLVNAVTSAVANGVNVSRTATTNRAFSLSQTNRIIQRR